MHWIDIIVLIPMCWFAYKGLKNGFLQEFISLCALFLGVFVSFKFSDLVVMWLTGGTLAKPVSFLLSFVVVLLLVNLLGGVLKRMLKPIFSEFIDKILGTLFGILKVVIVFAVIFYFIDSVDKNERIVKHDAKQQSIAYKYIAPITPLITAWQNSDTKSE